MINWKKIAEQNGLSPEEFSTEILTAAAVVGVMRIDNEGSPDEALKLTCSDEVGKIEVIIRRV